MRATEQAVCSWGGEESSSSPGSSADEAAGGGGGGGDTPQPFRPFQGFLSFGRWGEVGNVSDCLERVSCVCRRPYRGRIVACRVVSPARARLLLGTFGVG